MRGLKRGRERRRIESGEYAFRVVETSDQNETPYLEVARVRRVDPVAVRLERSAGCVERLRGPREVARHERDLRLGDDASRTRDRLLRPEGALGASHEVLRARKVAQLRHRDAAQRERRRVVAQRYAIERAERVAGGERARRRRDHGVHSNPRQTCHSHPSRLRP